MICTTIKEGVGECAFMTKKGCSFNGGACHPIVEACVGCERAKEFPQGTFCISFPEPESKWRRGICNMATHMKTQAKIEEFKTEPDQGFQASPAAVANPSFLHRSFGGVTHSSPFFLRSISEMAGLKKFYSGRRRGACPFNASGRIVLYGFCPISVLASASLIRSRPCLLSSREMA